MVGGPLRVLRFPPPINTGRYDIAEILLKVTLSTIHQIKSNRVLAIKIPSFILLWLKTGR